MKNNLLYTQWIPLHDVKEFFRYKESQIRNLIKYNKLKVSKVGNRKFVELKSINDLLNNHIL